MFPETTIAPSTTMPTANASPASEITLRLWPVRCSAVNVASRQIGIALAMSTVARQSRMNHHTQSSDSSAPTMRFSVSRLTARLMNSDESNDCSMPRPLALSTPPRMSAMTFFTAVSVASTFAPLALCTSRPIAGLPF